MSGVSVFPVWLPAVVHGDSMKQVNTLPFSRHSARCGQQRHLDGRCCRTSSGSCGTAMCAPGCPPLATGLPFALPSQAFRFRLARAVFRRRTGAIPRVLPKPPLEFADGLLQLLNGSPELLYRACQRGIGRRQGFQAWTPAPRSVSCIAQVQAAVQAWLASEVCSWTLSVSTALAMHLACLDRRRRAAASSPRRRNIRASFSRMAFWLRLYSVA